MGRASAKRALRVELNRAVSAIGPRDRSQWDNDIAARLISLDEFGGALQILGYLALSDEPDLGEVLIAACARSTPVFLPLVPTASDKTFVRWWPRDGYSAGTRGAWLPSDFASPIAVPSVVLVPGRAFDPEGYRLGRGGGWYDRALPSLRSFATIVGVAYDCQIVPMVPREPHDRRVDIVVTERRLLRVQRESGSGAD
jgi:5-formyltetrahydrofolate cyclo-ligase